LAMFPPLNSSSDSCLSVSLFLMISVPPCSRNVLWTLFIIDLSQTKENQKKMDGIQRSMRERDLVARPRAGPAPLVLVRASWAPSGNFSSYIVSSGKY
jgi:hypothetical protein